MSMPAETIVYIMDADHDGLAPLEFSSTTGSYTGPTFNNGPSNVGVFTIYVNMQYVVYIHDNGCGGSPIVAGYDPSLFGPVPPSLPYGPSDYTLGQGQLYQLTNRNVFGTPGVPYTVSWHL